MFELPAPLAVTCHDAGAANLILAWLAASPQIQVRPVMQGPAARLWETRFQGIPLIDSIDAALEGATALLSGTGWASPFEHQARVRAAGLGIPSFAVIDHWVNYRERFCRDGQTVLPDEIWVTDEYAVLEAKRCFPGRPVLLRENLYLQGQLARIPPPPTPVSTDVLYTLEPVRNDWGRGVPGEFQALDYFVSHLEQVGLPADTLIHLRPHPSDSPGKYDGWMQRHQEVRTVLDDSVDIASALGQVGWVAGCESFALVIALHAGRKVVCTLPPWAPPCRLPHDGLIHLKEMASS